MPRCDLEVLDSFPGSASDGRSDPDDVVKVVVVDVVVVVVTLMLFWESMCYS